MNTVKGYEKLVAVYQDAHDQAAKGKGDERHANGQPFHEQRMQQISGLLRSSDGMAFQAIKKLTEGLQFEDHARREAELLGALNYIAGIVIYYRELLPREVLEPNWPESAEVRSAQIMQNGNEGEHYRETLIGKRAAGGIIIGFQCDDAIIMASSPQGSMNWFEAFEFCGTFFHDGHNDWSLPTKNQLNLAWVNREKLDDLNLDYSWYWSSTLHSARGSWSQYFCDGFQDGSGKNCIFRVRPVRSVKIQDLEFEGSEEVVK